MQNAEKFVCLLDSSVLTSGMGTFKPISVEVHILFAYQVQSMKVK